MRLPLATALVVLCGAMSAFAQDEEDAAEVTYLEARQHQLSEPPVFYTGWRDTPDLLRLSFEEEWSVHLVVGEDGRVVSAAVEYGPEEHRDEALAAASSVTFTPFEREGRPVRAEVEIRVHARPLDYVGPPERAFPESVDLSTARIRLVRTGCFGTCPSYEVEIHGNGDVLYRGESSVLVTGEHRWRVPQANVEQMISLMREANYFALEGHYIANASDLPTYITALDIGDQHKFVLNYGGSGMGGAVASTVMGPTAGPVMPAAVTEIERAIDRLSGVETYLNGDARTIAALRAEGVNFRSESGAQMLGFALVNCDVTLARALLAEGAPANGQYSYFGEPQPLILFAPRCGDTDFARALIARGALSGRQRADAFLRASAASGFPEMVRLALQRSQAVNNRDRGDYPPLMSAASALDPPDFGARNPQISAFDRAETVRLLLRAGADPNYRDREMGWTPLHFADDTAVVRLLIEAGANVNAQDGSGETPLFKQFEGEAVRALIEGGADVRTRDHRGRTALFNAGSADVARFLIAAGLDPNDRDDEGSTPIETVQDEDAALTLLAAGARMPTDPRRLSTLHRGARASGWSHMLPHLEAYARSNGIQIEDQP